MPSVFRRADWPLKRLRILRAARGNCAQATHIQIHQYARIIQSGFQLVLFTDPACPPAKSVIRTCQGWLVDVIASKRSWVPERDVPELLGVAGHLLPVA